MLTCQQLKGDKIMEKEKKDFLFNIFLVLRDDIFNYATFKKALDNVNTDKSGFRNEHEKAMFIKMCNETVSNASSNIYDGIKEYGLKNIKDMFNVAIEAIGGTIEYVERKEEYCDKILGYEKQILEYDLYENCGDVYSPLKIAKKYLNEELEKVKYTSDIFSSGLIVELKDNKVQEDANQTEK